MIGREFLKFCYCDETGTGEEPFAVLVGIIVDASRMGVTKKEWALLLVALSKMSGKKFDELHTRNFYSGSGFWKSIDGDTRSKIITYLLTWIGKRKHHIVFSAIDKKVFADMRGEAEIPEEISTVWNAMGFHLMLSIQKHHQKESKNKGNTIFIFDNEVKEETKFKQLILNPPEWSDIYYSKDKKQDQLCQIVDAPYFADSKDVGLIQVADFVTFFLRRYIEIKEGAVPARYDGEEQKVEHWFNLMKRRFIPMSAMYPKTKCCKAAQLFLDISPPCVKDI